MSCAFRSFKSSRVLIDPGIPALAGVSRLLGCRVLQGVTLAAIAAFAPSALAADDANADFSLTLNPSGAWSYGSSVGRFGAFTLLPTPLNVNGAWFWSTSNNLPWIGKNPTSAPVGIADNPVLPAGVMMMHPGFSGAAEIEAVLRWTSPANGTYRVDAEFGGILIDPNPTSVDVSVLRGGVELFAQDISGVAPGTTYGGVFTLAVGEVLDFHVGQGANGTIFNDSTAIQVVITRCPVIAQHPADQSTCPSGTAAFSVTPAGASLFTYQWQVADTTAPDGWASLSDGPVVRAGVNVGSGTGSRTSEYVFQNNQTNLEFLTFRCVVSNSCGSVTSNPATLAVCACLECPADFNQDGGIDGADVDGFFGVWEAGSCNADVNADGGVDAADVDSFFAAWEAGGC